jgi:hypothetical protein
MAVGLTLSAQDPLACCRVWLKDVSPPGVRMREHEAGREDPFIAYPALRSPACATAAGPFCTGLAHVLPLSHIQALARSSAAYWIGLRLCN